MSLRGRRTVLNSHLLVVLTFIAMGACGDEEEVTAPASPPPTPAKADSSKSGDAASAEEESSSDEYAYNPIGKRDPFRSFITTEDKEDFKPQTPLQKYEIDQYRLTGIVWGIERPRALVEDPEGVGHVVELGTYIGRNWGKVTQITSTEIVVTEEYLTPDGALVVNPIEIPLQSIEEEKSR